MLSGPTTPAKGANQIQTSAGSHKLSIRDRQLAESLKNRGAHVIADYGNFVLLEANDALANSLAGNASAEIVDYNNLILLNARTIDTGRLTLNQFVALGPRKAATKCV